MNKHARKFFEAILFAYQWDDSNLNKSDWTVRDFSPESVQGAESFIDGFLKRLDDKGIDYSWLERPMGHDIFFSLSGHGIGFWEWRDHKRGNALQAELEAYAGNAYLFEDIYLVPNSERKLNLCFPGNWQDATGCKEYAKVGVAKELRKKTKKRGCNKSGN